MALLKRKRVLAAALEATVGTAESLDATDAVFNIYETDIQADIDYEEREGQSSFDPLPGTLGEYGGTIKFSTDIIGGTPTAAAWMTTFMPACGMVASGLVYSPSTAAPAATGVRTLTLGVYENGLYKQIHGAVGNAVFHFPTGRRCFVEFEFTGLWSDPSDVAIITPTYVTTSPIRFANGTLTVGGTALKSNEVVIDLQNEITLRHDAGAGASGYFSAIITGRKPTVTIDPESAIVATDDQYGDWTARNEDILVLTAGTAGNLMTVGAPKMTRSDVQESDRDNLQTDDITYMCHRGAVGGEDCLTFTSA